MRLNRSLPFPSRNGKSILRGWAVSYCIILLLPILMAICNQVYGRGVLEREMETVNRGIIENLAANFDSTMVQLSDSCEIIYSSAEANALKTVTSQARLATASYNMRLLLMTHCRVDSAMSLSVYLPAFDHLINESGGYTTEGTWRTLIENSSILPDLSYSDWLSGLTCVDPFPRYFFSDAAGYKTFGMESLSYVLPIPMSLASNGVYCLIASRSIDNLLSIQDAMPDQSLMVIALPDGSIIRAWDSAGTVMELDTLPQTSVGKHNITLDGMKYISMAVPSSVNNWIYLMLTPSSVFSKSLNTLNGIFFSLLAITLAVGAGLVLLFMKRHYSPVNQILSVVEANQRIAGNEYDRILAACHSLTDENTSIKDRLSVQEAYLQEKFLLSKLLHRGLRPADPEIALRATERFDGKVIRIISFCLTLPQDTETQLADHFDTMQFRVHQLLCEQLNGLMDPIRVVDNNCLVYVFPITPDQNETWPSDAAHIAAAVCDRFEAEQKLPLLAVLSNACERLDLCHETYSELTGVIECLSAAGESGAIPVRDVLKRNEHLRTSRQIAGYKLREAIEKGDAATANQYLTDLYGYITEKSSLSFSVTRFLYYNILNLVAKALTSVLPDDVRAQEQTQIRLGELMASSDQEEMESAIRLLVQETCQYIQRRTSASSDCTARSVCEYIEQNYADPSLNISHIAGALNLCSQTVTKYCKQESSMSVLDYIARIRIDHAKQLAENTDMSLEDIAEAVGYSSMRTFHRAYSKLEGTTPGRGLGRV